MTTRQDAPRIFLFLQGPHGPFFAGLAARLEAAGHKSLRVGFNRGDALFWRRPGYIAFTGDRADWPDRLAEILGREAVTDIVLYGDTRPVHAEAVAQGRARGLRVHVFEEGYLRPYWVSYERGGANGHSPLMQLSVAEMEAALAGDLRPPTEAPGHWGETRAHVIWGALYHAAVLWANGRYGAPRSHRAISVRAEFHLYIKRLALMPWHGLRRYLATRALARKGQPYHVALLQLEHDASFLHHSPFHSMTEFLDLVISSFAKGAPVHHQLVFKDHPLEDGRVNLGREIARLARVHGVGDRVHHLRGGKLGALLDGARTAVTINSTAGQQVLWRGLPIKTFGTAIYSKDSFVSQQPLPEFFANPAPPDHARYLAFRDYLLRTSQIPGSYYSRRGRAQLYRQLTDCLLAEGDRYENLAKSGAARPQHLHAIP